MGIENILTKIESWNDEMVARRRDFHKYAEPGWREYRTTAAIIKILKEHQIPFKYGHEIINPIFLWSYPSQDILEIHQKRAIEQGADPEIIKEMKGFTGACAIIHTGKPGKTIAIRFDIDCNDVNETVDPNHFPLQKGFSSINAGCMHACGHDGHATMGLYTALALNELKDELCGTIKIIFQPAEEGVKGAQSIAEGGILDDVDIFLSSHLGMGYKTGELIGLTKDFLSTTKIDATFHGVSAHAGMVPQEGRSAILAASSAVLAMHTFCQDSRGASRINVGTIHGGTGRNVVPDTAVIQIETRGQKADIERNVYHRAMESIEGAAKMFGCSVETSIMGSASSADSDWALEPYINRAQARLPEIIKYQPEAAFTGSEDATYLMAKVQEHGGLATYMGVGADIAAPHHNGKFNFDEKALVINVKLHTAIVWEICIEQLQADHA